MAEMFPEHQPFVDQALQVASSGQKRELTARELEILPFLADVLEVPESHIV
jgi:hypothetical protein